MNATREDRNQEHTVYIGNIDEKVTDALLWELMLQAGPISHIHLPKDRVNQNHQGYAFCEYGSEEDTDYAIKILNMVKLFGRPIRINKASSDRKNVEVGATLFIGNLDLDVDEKLLYDTFMAFGTITQTPKIACDPDTGASRGFGFVSFDCFEASDAAIEAMNGQFLMNQCINLSYAYKKDGKGERHGSAAERLLASEARKNMPVAALPNRKYADVGASGANRAPLAAAPPPPPPGFNPMMANVPHPPPPMMGYGIPMPGGIVGMPPPPPPLMASGYLPPHFAQPPPPPGF